MDNRLRALEIQHLSDPENVSSLLSYLQARTRAFGSPVSDTAIRTYINQIFRPCLNRMLFEQVLHCYLEESAASERHTWDYEFRPPDKTFEWWKLVLTCTIVDDVYRSVQSYASRFFDCDFNSLNWSHLAFYYSQYLRHYKQHIVGFCDFHNRREPCERCSIYYNNYPTGAYDMQYGFTDLSISPSKQDTQIVLNFRPTVKMWGELIRLTLYGKAYD